jgi:hypothetical protein
MKHAIFFLLVALVAALTGCVSVKNVGDLNLISAKNINMDAPGVSLLASSQTMSRREIKKTASANTLEAAVTEATDKVPGGVCLGNVQVYYVSRVWRKDCFVVQADVWGTKNGDFSGFRATEKVMYMRKGKGKPATITAFRDSRTAIIVIDGETQNIEVPISDLAKIQ